MALQQRQVVCKARTAFSGRIVTCKKCIAAPSRQRSVSVRAMVREWPDREFIAETLSIFPDEGVANVEQARVSLMFSKHALLSSMGHPGHLLMQWHLQSAALAIAVP